MEKLFIPYKESLQLKDLGFDEPCLTMYEENFKGAEKIKWFHDMGHLERFSNFTNGKWISWSPNPTRPNYYELPDVALRPLYQQVFDWFREEHGLLYSIIPEFYTGGINFNWQLRWYLPKEEWTEHVISDGTYWYGDNGEYPTQEEAELATLRKMIEKVTDGKERL